MPPRPTPWPPRFWALVDQSDPSGCWPWKGSVERYGRFTLPGRRTRYAHRLAYEQRVGPIPGGIQVRHTCDNPVCCNPAHLVLGTQAENLADMVERGRSKRGEKHWNVRLTEEEVAAIRADIRPSTVVGPEYGVHPRHVRRIRQGVRWAK